MGKLHADGGAVLMHEVDDGLERRDLLVRPEAEVPDADPCSRLHGRALDEDEPRPAKGELAQMNQMPCAGAAALHRRVLAHGRYDHTVLELQPRICRGWKR